MGVEPKIGVGTPSPKWDGLFHGKPYFLMEDSGGPPLFWGNTLNECMKHMWWWECWMTYEYDIIIWWLWYMMLMYIFWSNYSDLTRPRSLFQGNLGFWNIVIWPDILHFLNVYTYYQVYVCCVLCKWKMCNSGNWLRHPHSGRYPNMNYSGTSPSSYIETSIPDHRFIVLKFQSTDDELLFLSNQLPHKFTNT